MMNTLIQSLNWRYGVKEFSSKIIAKETLTTLLEATRLSASSYGLQPFNILVVKSEYIRQKLLPFAFGQNKVLNCSHLVILAAHTNVGDNTVERYMTKYCEVQGVSPKSISGYAQHMKSALANKNAEQRLAWSKEQAYIALGNLLTSAALLKVDACPMTGFDVEGFDSVLGLSARHLTSTIICPIGYRHPNDLSALQKKVRFNLSDIVIEY